MGILDKCVVEYNDKNGLLNMEQLAAKHNVTC